MELRLAKSGTDVRAELLNLLLAPSTMQQDYRSFDSSAKPQSCRADASFLDGDGLLEVVSDMDTDEILLASEPNAEQLQHDATAVSADKGHSWVGEEEERRLRELVQTVSASGTGNRYRFYCPSAVDMELMRYRLTPAAAAFPHPGNLHATKALIWPELALSVESTAVSYIKLRVLRIRAVMAANQHPGIAATGVVFKVPLPPGSHTVHRVSNGRSKDLPGNITVNANTTAVFWSLPLLRPTTEHGQWAPELVLNCGGLRNPLAIKDSAGGGVSQTTTGTAWNSETSTTAKSTALYSRDPPWTPVAEQIEVSYSLVAHAPGPVTSAAIELEDANRDGTMQGDGWCRFIEHVHQIHAETVPPAGFGDARRPLADAALTTNRPSKTAAKLLRAAAKSAKSVVAQQHGSELEHPFISSRNAAGSGWRRLPQLAKPDVEGAACVKSHWSGTPTTGAERDPYDSWSEARGPTTVSPSSFGHDQSV
eukprot:SAG31_NODE_4183_length_3495_cov_1.668728_2_plen_480_part_00